MGQVWVCPQCGKEYTVVDMSETTFAKKLPGKMQDALKGKKVWRATEEHASV